MLVCPLAVPIIHRRPLDIMSEVNCEIHSSPRPVTWNAGVICSSARVSFGCAESYIAPHPTSPVQEHSVTAGLSEPLLLPPCKPYLCSCGASLRDVVQQVSTAALQHVHIAI